MSLFPTSEHPTSQHPNVLYPDAHFVATASHFTQDQLRTLREICGPELYRSILIQRYYFGIGTQNPIIPDLPVQDPLTADLPNSVSASASVSTRHNRPSIQPSKRRYTCGCCRKHWEKGSTEKRHNSKTCPHKQQRPTHTTIPTTTTFNEDCIICCNETTDFKTKCDHYFCKSCLKKWCNQFKYKTKRADCPCCRKPILKDDLQQLGLRPNFQSWRSFAL